MSPKVTATRAVLFVLAKRTINFATIVGVIVFATIFALFWALANYVSGWWWLLLIVYIPILLVAAVIRLIAGFIANRIYPKRLLKHQRQKANAFADKLKRLAETRGMGWPVFAFLSFKDLLFYQDLRTARNTIDDATSLRRDFKDLEDSFS